MHCGRLSLGLQYRLNFLVQDGAMTSLPVSCSFGGRLSDEELAVVETDRGGAACCCVLPEHRQPL